MHTSKGSHQGRLLLALLLLLALGGAVGVIRWREATTPQGGPAAVQDAAAREHADADVAPAKVGRNAQDRLRYSVNPGGPSTTQNPMREEDLFKIEDYW